MPAAQQPPPPTPNLALEIPPLSPGAAALAAGIEPWNLVLDPGLGFGKQGPQSSELLGRLRELRGMMAGPLQHAPWLVGASRKRFLAPAAGGAPPAERDVASAAAAALAVAGGAVFVRAHNVAVTRQAVDVAHAAMQRAPRAEQQ